jgi:hypothetical protein
MGTNQVKSQKSKVKIKELLGTGDWDFLFTTHNSAPAKRRATANTTQHSPTHQRLLQTVTRSQYDGDDGVTMP